MSDSMLKKVDWSRTPRRALSPTEIVTQLAQHPGWTLAGSGSEVAIEKTYRFANYYETISFVNALAFIANAQDHHPDLHPINSSNAHTTTLSLNLALDTGSSLTCSHAVLGS